MRILVDGQIGAPRSVLALGMFDGVHLGHQALLKIAKAQAGKLGLPLVACTFITHPMGLVCPAKAPPMLTTLAERAVILKNMGVDILYCQRFHKKTMRMLPELYIARLYRQFHPSMAVVGYNYSFGRNGAGNPAILTDFGAANGFSVQVLPKITLDGEEVSSTAIRGLLGTGDAQKARRMLGRPYSRPAMAVSKGNGRYELKMKADGKQNVPKGSYRVVADDGKYAYSATVAVENESTASMILPEGAVLVGEVRVRFLG